MIKDFINYLVEKFPAEVEITNTFYNIFDNGKRLFKDGNNEYLCISPKQTNLIRIEIFKSNYKDLEKIEDDYLNYCSTYLFSNIEDFKTFINSKH